MKINTAKNMISREKKKRTKWKWIRSWRWWVEGRGRYLHLCRTRLRLQRNLPMWQQATQQRIKSFTIYKRFVESHFICLRHIRRSRRDRMRLRVDQVLYLRTSCAIYYVIYIIHISSLLIDAQFIRPCFVFASRSFLLPTSARIICSIRHTVRQSQYITCVLRR